MKLYLDPGHGGTDPGAVGNGLQEKDITLDIALRIQSILITQYKNVEVMLSRTTDITKSLARRTSEANNWGASYYMSIHCNSATGSANGYEDFIYSNVSDSSASAAYQNIIHSEVVRVNQLKDRGKKKANFHVLRESKIPAILTENGFIDHRDDVLLMKNPSWREKVAQGHVVGVAKAFNLQLKTEEALTKPVTEVPNMIPDSNQLFKVFAGSFKNRENAEQRVTFLQSKGIEAFVTTVNLSGGIWYRVQAGAFSKRSNAEERIEKIKQAGIHDAFIIENSSSENTAPNENQRDVGIPNEDSQAFRSISSILGPTILSPLQMNAFVKSVNPNAIELGHDYLIMGDAYGIRGDIAFAQAIHETNYFRFTGDVDTNQNNFAGIGATGKGTQGASFDTPRDGVLAHIQHLYAYASTACLPNKYPLVDPRFNLVQRGSATTWVALNGKWAVPGTTYGQSVLNLYESMVAFTIQKLEELQKDIPS